MKKSYRLPLIMFAFLSAQNAFALKQRAQSFKRAQSFVRSRLSRIPTISKAAKRWETTFAGGPTAADLQPAPPLRRSFSVMSKAELPITDQSDRKILRKQLSFAGHEIARRLRLKQEVQQKAQQNLLERIEYIDPEFLNKWKPLIKSQGINAVDSGGYTLLYAINDPALLKLAVRAGADVNVRDKEGLSPLILALAHEDANSEFIRQLVEAGAVVGSQELNIAVLKSTVDKTKVLLDLKPGIINERDQTGRSALDHAIRIGSSHEMLQLLLDRGDAVPDLTRRILLDIGVAKLPKQGVSQTVIHRFVPLDSDLGWKEWVKNYWWAPVPLEQGLESKSFDIGEVHEWPTYAQTRRLPGKPSAAWEQAAEEKSIQTITESLPSVLPPEIIGQINPKMVQKLLISPRFIEKTLEPYKKPYPEAVERPPFFSEGQELPSPLKAELEVEREAFGIHSDRIRFVEPPPGKESAMFAAEGLARMQLKTDAIQPEFGRFTPLHEWGHLIKQHGTIKQYLRVLGSDPKLHALTQAEETQADIFAAARGAAKGGAILFRSRMPKKKPSSTKEFTEATSHPPQWQRAQILEAIYQQEEALKQERAFGWPRAQAAP